MPVKVFKVIASTDYRFNFLQEILDLMSINFKCINLQAISVQVELTLNS